MTLVDDRAVMSTASINNLPDSAFAYIEPGGTKDSTGRTMPRSKRHFPIHDEAHVRAALSRAPQSPFGKLAMPKIMAAAKKMGIQVSQANSAESAGLLERSVPFEVGAPSDGLTLEGYAAVFNSPTRIDSWEGRFDETILPGAFSRSISERMPVLMFEHGRHPLIGSMPLGVITRAEEDSTGLHIQARLSDNWLIQPVRDAVRDGGVTGMSFRFEVPDGGDTWQRRPGNVDLRSISELRARELGPVVFPAYEPTTATIRSLVERLPDLDESRQLPTVESGDSPAMLAQAACAAMDSAMAACGMTSAAAMAGMTPEMQQACALMMAADTALDALLAALGVLDLPETGGGRSHDLTGRPARGAGGGDSTDTIRQRDECALRLRGILR